MPLNCPYQTRFIQQFSTVVDCLGTSVPVQTQSAESNWYVSEPQSETISAGNGHSAAIKADGTLWLWGDNRVGGLGNLSQSDRSSPVQTVSATTNWKQVSLGHEFSGAIKTDGTLWLWGQGADGRLGIDSNLSQSSPVQTIACGTNWKQVSLGNDFAGAIKTDGTLWLWGRNGSSNLGTGDGVDRSSPVQTVCTGTNWSQVSLGSSTAFYHSAAIKTDNTLWMWGTGFRGRLGNGSDATVSVPTQTTGGASNWKQVSLGGEHSGAIKTDGTLWLWGCGLSGQIGNNDTIDVSAPGQTAFATNDWKQVSLGDCHSSALKTDGTLWMWGEANCGFLGTGNNSDRSTPVQTSRGGTNWVNVDLGKTHSVAIKTDGTLWLWGCNAQGQLGNDSVADSNQPIQTNTATTTWINFDDPVFSLSLAGGTRGSAAVKADGTLWLWGCNNAGQIGNNSTINQSSPTQTVSATTNWKQISLSAFAHVVGLKTDGTLWTWGCGGQGQLGNNNTIDQSSPVQTISATNNWCQIAAGREHAAGIKTDGTLWLWGVGSVGRLGDNTTTNRSSPVQTVSTGTNWKQVSLGCDHSGAIKTDGTLWMWGCNANGQVGNIFTAFDYSSPLQVTGTGTNWKQLSLGNKFSAAVKTDGTLWLWGEALCGKIGDNATTNRTSPVQPITTGTNWKQVSLSYGDHTTAIKTDGTLWAWGLGTSGQLGDGTAASKSSPVQTICTGIYWKQLPDHQGGVNSSAISADNRLYVWGPNDVGQLGCNLTAGSTTPTDLGNILLSKEYLLEVYPNLIPNMKAPALWVWGNGGCGVLGTNDTINVSLSSPVQTVSAGTNWNYLPSHSLSLATIEKHVSGAIKTDGTLWMWGRNGCGMLGDNSSIDKSSPTQTISRTTNWKQLSVSSSGAAAVKTDGTLWLWGYAPGGRLGNNDAFNNRSSPVQTVSTGTNWKQVSVGTSGTSGPSAAVKTDGTLWLWAGGSNGALGNNNTINVSSPVQTISTGTNWVQVAVGPQSAAAVKSDGTLWLWGRGNCGILGDGSTTNKSSPVQTLSATTNWKQVVMGVGDTAAAIKTDGTLWLWGCGTTGSLGNNVAAMRCSPVQTISTGTNWKQVSMGADATAAIKTDGTLWIWGYSGDGNFSSPIQIPSPSTDWKQVAVVERSFFAIRESYDW